MGKFSRFDSRRQGGRTRRPAIHIRDLDIGTVAFVVMAGPCAVDSEWQLLPAAEAVADAGAQVLRGGAFKPRSSLNSFQGLGEDGFKLLSKARGETGLAIVQSVRIIT